MALIVVNKEKVVEFELDKKAVQETTKRLNEKSAAIKKKIAEAEARGEVYKPPFSLPATNF